MNKGFITFVIFLVIFLGLAVFLSQAGQASSWIWEVSRQGQWFLPLLAVSALVDSINPCAFSILIVSLIFLFSMGLTSRKIIRYGLSYVFGIFLAYFLIGLGLLQALHIFGIPHFMSKIGAGMLVLFGLLSITEALWPAFPIKLGVPTAAHAKMNQLLNKASLPAMFFLGMLVGLCEFPCTGGPYLMVIGLLHDARSYWRGVGYLILYNVIFILPLVLLLIVGSHSTVIEKVKAWQKSNAKTMRLIAGFAMIALAIIILSI